MGQRTGQEFKREWVSKVVCVCVCLRVRVCVFVCVYVCEGGIKAGGPRQARTRKQRKYLIGIKCPDRVRGRPNSAKRAAFPLAKKKKKPCTRVREKEKRRGKKIWKSPCIWVILFLGGLEKTNDRRVWRKATTAFSFQTLLSSQALDTTVPLKAKWAVGRQTEETVPDDKIKPLIKFPIV